MDHCHTTWPLASRSAIGRVQFELARAGARRQPELQGLVALADDAGLHAFAGFGVAIAVVPIQLGRIQGLRRQQRGLACGRCRAAAQELVGQLGAGLRVGADDELVALRIGQGQQVAGHAGWHGVEGHLKL